MWQQRTVGHAQVPRASVQDKKTRTGVLAKMLCILLGDTVASRGFGARHSRDTRHGHDLPRGGDPGGIPDQSL